MLDVPRVITFGEPKNFGVGCTHKVHAEISAKIMENGHFRPKIENPQMCLLGAYTAPQNLAPKSMLPYLSDHVKTLGHSHHIFLTPDYKMYKIDLFGD